MISKKLLLIGLVILSFAPAAMAMKTTLRFNGPVQAAVVGWGGIGSLDLKDVQGTNIWIDGDAAMALTKVLARTITPNESESIKVYAGKNITCREYEQNGNLKYDCEMGMDNTGTLSPQLYPEPRGGASVHTLQ